jgi:cell division protein FtsI (penicillin-binding protein 3)
VLVARHDPSAEHAMTPTVASTGNLPPATLEPVRNGLMPDLRGLSAREALRLLSQIGMTARMSGNGFVVDQRPHAGSPLVRGETCALTLDRRGAVLPIGGPQ